MTAKRVVKRLPPTMEKDRRQTFYQGVSDLYIIAWCLAIRHDRSYEQELHANDGDDLRVIARMAARIIARGPERYRHVIEDSDSAAGFAQQLID